MVRNTFVPAGLTKRICRKVVKPLVSKAVWERAYPRDRTWVANYYGIGII